MSKTTKLVNVPGDGHCLFECIRLFLETISTIKTKHQIRKEICDFLEQNKDLFKDFFVDSEQNGGQDQESKETFEKHLENQRKGINQEVVQQESWGSQVEIVAASYLYKLDISVEDNGNLIRCTDSKVDSSKFHLLKLYRKDKIHYQVYLDVDVPRDDFKTTTEKSKALLSTIFSDKSIVCKLNISPLLSINLESIKVILDNNKGAPLEDPEKLGNAIGEVYGALSKFYSENKHVKEADFSRLHYQIVFIGDTSAGKDSTLANIVQEDIGYSAKELTTKFPERIIKQRVNSGPTIYKFYKEGDSVKAKEFSSIQELNDVRIPRHKAYDSVTFETHSIEIQSSDPSTVPVTILNLPGFTNVNPRNNQDLGHKIYEGLESEIRKLVSTGIGSIYIIRRCKNIIENESWVNFFFKNDTIKKEHIQNLDFVVVHTHTYDNIFKEENGEMIIPKDIKTYDDILNDLQVNAVDAYFKEFGISKPTQIFIENWDSKSDDFIKARTDPKELKKFLKNNDQKLLAKVKKLEGYINGKIASVNDESAFKNFLSYFGINRLRQVYLEKISQPTSSQIHGLSDALYNGANTIQLMLEESFQKIQTYHKSKVGENLYNIHKDFSQHRPIFSTDTAFQLDVSQNDLKELRKEISKNAFEEFDFMKNIHDHLSDICHGNKKIMEIWINILKSDQRGNQKPYLDFKNSSIRLKDNIFELAKIIPFKRLSKEEFDSITSHLNYSTSGQTKRDGLNLHVLQQLKWVIEKLAPFISKYISNLWYKRVCAIYDLVKVKYEDLDRDLLESFSNALKYIYEDQLRKVIEKDIETYSKENFFLIDPSTLTIFNEIINAAPEDKKQKVRKFMETLLVKDLSNEDLEIMKDLVRDNNLDMRLLKKLGLPVTEKDKSKDGVDIENDYESACNYQAVAFRVQIKRSVESMWNNCVLKNLNKFHVFSKDFHAETVWLLKITLIKLFSTRDLTEILKKFTDSSLQNVLEHSGHLSLKSNINTLLPPIELEKKSVQTNNLQGLVPYWENHFIEAKLNSFFEPFTLNIQQYVLQKLNERKFDKYPILKLCNDFIEKVTKMVQMEDIFESINTSELSITYYDDWNNRVMDVMKVKEIVEKEEEPKVFQGGKVNSKIIKKDLKNILKMEQK